MINRKKKIALAATSVALVAMLAVGGTLAFFTDKDTKQNVITMGKVDGELTETGESGRDDGTSGKDYTNVKPGEVLEKDPTITLAGDSLDAYVRVTLDYAGTLTEQQVSELEAELPLEAGWIKSGNYYYYNQKLSNGEGGIKSAALFKQVKIPSKWGNEVAEMVFKINVNAELIQADNFTPETNAEGLITGWGDVTIEQYQPR